MARTIAKKAGALTEVAASDCLSGAAAMHNLPLCQRGNEGDFTVHFWKDFLPTILLSGNIYFQIHIILEYRIAGDDRR